MPQIVAAPAINEGDGLCLKLLMCGSHVVVMMLWAGDGVVEDQRCDV